MRNVKYACAIILSVLLVLISTVLSTDFAYVSGSLVGIGAALLGSFVVMWYETSKEDRKKFEKRKKALAVVHTDITQALGPLEKAPKKGTLMIHPFSRTGWDIFTMSGSFNLELELDLKIADVYERLANLNGD